MGHHIHLPMSGQVKLWEKKFLCYILPTNHQGRVGILHKIIAIQEKTKTYTISSEITGIKSNARWIQTSPIIKVFISFLKEGNAVIFRLKFQHDTPISFADRILHCSHYLEHINKLHDHQLHAWHNWYIFQDRC